jgi:signal transduction histidine kinase/CheY-like chemotaxis protein
MGKFRDRIEHFVYSDDLPLDTRVLNIFGVIGIVAMFAVTIMRLIITSDAAIVLIMVGMLAALGLLLYFGNKFRNSRIPLHIFLVLMMDVLFPVIFFMLSGMDGGMSAFFVMSIATVFLLTRGKASFWFVLTHLLIITACYIIAYKYPLTVHDLSRDILLLEDLLSVFVGGMFIGFAIKFQNQIYIRGKAQTDAALRAVARHSELLNTLNESASVLLAGSGDSLRDSIKKGISMIAGCVDVDRVYIWRYHSLPDGSQSYVREFDWSGVEGEHDPGPSEFKYGTGFIDWDKSFLRGECVNGPLRVLAGDDKELLAPKALKSLLAVPAFFNGQYWGFVSFDDFKSERVFPDNEVRILESGVMLLVSALVRRKNENMLSTRLMQQELMSDISQSFISKAHMAGLIQNALRSVGEFLGVQRVLIGVTDPDSEESHPAYVWFKTEEFRPAKSTVGFNTVISTTFPRFAPEEGSVPTLFCNNVLTDHEKRYEVFAMRGLRAFVWAPIYVNGRYWGVLSIEDCVAPREWSEDDAQLVGTVSSAIAGAVARDIIDGERADALEQAVSASRAKSSFLSNMSHEMRTPMNAIIGMTAIANGAGNIERKDYCLQKIEEASTHLLGVINDILDMSKIEANKLELSPASFSFERMLQNTVNVINFRVDERKQSFNVRIDSEIPQILIGDDQRLSQVITNLLSNSVKFTPVGGSVGLDTQLLDEEDGVCTIRIEVYDNGIGISQEQQSRLFTSFEQAESGTSRKFGGTGLGLAISKRIVEMMGGTIWIESELGKGSHFIFTVQLQRGVQEKKTVLAPGVNWGNVRVLAVDDEPVILEYIKDLTSQFGVVCETAESGEDAVAQMDELGPFDIYFVDWRMPGMNGMELSRRIKQRDGGKSVVIMISATEWGVIEDEARLAGVDRFLQKPLFPSAIADAINECLGVESGVRRSGAGELQVNDFSGYRILLAEDVDINREIVLSLLEPTRLEIDCAEDGLAAVEMFKAEPSRYDMIFMDVQMPKLDGYQATRAIRELGMPKALGIPIVAMTANVFREDVERCIASGMDDHVGKPLDFSEVMLKLRKYLRKK